MAYRSYYFPVKDVLDGDLCEQYTQVSTCSPAAPAHLQLLGSPSWLMAVTRHSLCIFVQITPDKQKAIAEELDRNPGEVLKKLEDVRNRIL